MTRKPERGCTRTFALEQAGGRLLASTLLSGMLMAGIALADPGAKGSREHVAEVTGKVDTHAIRANAARGENWPAYGLDHAETRHSPLSEISADNVGRLGLVWSYNLESTRGVEATPLVVDGIMYVTASWSVVHAVDVRTGKRLWSYDPKVPREMAFKGCCDVVNRGVALYKGKVFVGTFDGRLVALDAATGKPVWEKDTIEDRSHSYTVTGAPRVIKGKVIIGNGGAEYGVRGYITAYDAESGDQKWRWYTVPGDPAKPFEDASMAKAAKTWDPAGKWWINGGGGTVWNSMAYDPELNLMYVGTGNGSPGTTASAARAEATISIWPPWWPSTRTPGNMSGTTRKPPATTGTTPRCRTSSSPTSRSRGKSARSSCTPRKTASSS